MRVFGINRADRPERLASCVRECEEVGLDFLRVNAVKAEDVDPQIVLATGLRQPQIACWQSHERAWRQLANSDLESALIVEDDVMWLQDPAPIFTFWNQRNSHRPEVLQLGSLASMSFKASKRGWVTHLMARAVHHTARRAPASRRLFEFAAPLNRASVRPTRPQVPSVQTPHPEMVFGEFGAGCHAYLITRKQALVLLDLGFNSPPLLPADNALDSLAKAGGVAVARLRIPVAGQSLFPSDIR